MKVDHIGYAVKDINTARITFESLGFKFGDLYNDTRRNILIQFGNNGGYCIELVSPNGIGECPIDNVLKTCGSTPYHICYKTNNIENEIKVLERQKFKIIVPLAPAVAFGEKRVVFLMNRVIGIIEIVEE